MAHSSLIPVIVNSSGGTASAAGDRLAERLSASFAAAGLAIDLHLIAPGKLAWHLDRVAGAPLVVVGGGDGTLGRAAGVLAKARSALGILPLGTRNHLAAQLGIPDDLGEAARVIAAGRRMRMDLGCAGGRVFINNASVGLYSRLVLAREEMPGPKWLGTIPAAWHVLRRLHAQLLDLSIGGTRRSLRTPLLFIGNNRYALDRGRLGERDSLADGELSFYAVAPRTPVQLLAMALRIVAGRANHGRDFLALTSAPSARLGGTGHVEIALDGEVDHLPLPLEFHSLPQALEVIVPDNAGAPERTARPEGTATN
jgi:diacylglycerol kinase family enzyme